MSSSPAEQGGMTPAAIGIAARGPSVAQPLHGFTVLDFSRFLPGPFATQMLADWGAEVIKVEGFPFGDFTRGTDPFLGFSASNRNKKSLHIDLRSPDARDVLARLVAKSDVLVELSRPGSMAQMGLDYESVRKIRPDIVYCSVSAYGQSGPYITQPAHGLNMDALAGMLEVRTAGDGSAFVSAQHPYLSSLLSAHMIANGILAGLLGRARSGEGVYIDASCWDCAVAGDPVETAAAATGVGMVSGFASRETPKYAPYRTADDRHIIVCAVERKFWAAFCDTIGRPDLAATFDRPEQASGDQTGIWGEGFPWVYDEVAKAIATKTLAEWEKVFAPTGIPVSPVLTRQEAMRGENAVARNMTLDGVDPMGRPYTMAAAPLVLNGERGSYGWPAPKLGAHNQEILAAIGYSEAEIGALRDKRAIS